LGSPGTVVHINGAQHIYATFGTANDIIDAKNFAGLVAEGIKHKFIICSVALRTFGVTHGEPLRSSVGKERYGMRMTDQTLKDEVRRDNLVLVRCHQLLDRFRESGLQCAMVTRAAAGECCSPAILDEYTDKLATQTWRLLKLQGCPFANVASDAYDVCASPEWSLLPLPCCHDVTCTTQSHCWAETLHSSAWLGPPLKLLLWMTLKAKLTVPDAVALSQQKPRQASDQLLGHRPRVPQEAPLRGHQLLVRPKDVEDEDIIGGLRHAHVAVKKIPWGDVAGKQLAGGLDHFLGTDIGGEDAKFLLSLIGGPKVEHTCEGISSPSTCKECRVLEIGCRVRHAILDALVTPPELRHCHKSSDPDVFTNMHHEVIDAWCSASGDPDTYTSQWLREGAPAGLSQMPQHAGIFAPTDLEEISHDGLSAYDFRAPTTLINSSYDEQLIVDEITALEKKGYVKSFKSAEDVKEYLQEDFYESKLFVLTQTKGDLVKHRVLLDCKKSCISKSSVKSERVKLPRAMDTVTNTLQLFTAGMRWVSETDAEFSDDVDYDVGYMVLDVTEAFWTVPLHPGERRYFVCRCRGIWYVVLRTAQGSRNGPLTWENHGTECTNGAEHCTT